jgi:hypothetical protein
MKTPSKNPASLGDVAKPAQNRPLQSIQETKMLMAQSPKKSSTKPKATFDTPHSKRSAMKSKEYHTVVIGQFPIV